MSKKQKKHNMQQHQPFCFWNEKQKCLYPFLLGGGWQDATPCVQMLKKNFS